MLGDVAVGLRLFGVFVGYQAAAETSLGLLEKRCVSFESANPLDW